MVEGIPLVASSCRWAGLCLLKWDNRIGLKPRLGINVSGFEMASTGHWRSFAELATVDAMGAIVGKMQRRSFLTFTKQSVTVSPWFFHIPAVFLRS